MATARGLLLGLTRTCSVVAAHAGVRRRALLAFGERSALAPTASLHTSAGRRSTQNPGPVEKKLKAEYANYVPPASIDPSVVAPAPGGKKLYR